KKSCAENAAFFILVEMKRIELSWVRACTRQPVREAQNSPQGLFYVHTHPVGRKFDPPISPNKKATKNSGLFIWWR
ncbi:MAG: hypothetical protein LH481_02785, partial [Burkholderiales bacterium]|nr:hypothetical protein [Burkholderiales bacterium]